MEFWLLQRQWRVTNKISSSKFKLTDSPKWQFHVVLNWVALARQTCRFSLCWQNGPVRACPSCSLIPPGDGGAFFRAALTTVPVAYCLLVLKLFHWLILLIKNRAIYYWQAIRTQGFLQRYWFWSFCWKVRGSRWKVQGLQQTPLVLWIHTFARNLIWNKCFNLAACSYVRLLTQHSCLNLKKRAPFCLVPKLPC